MADSFQLILSRLVIDDTPQMRLARLKAFNASFQKYTSQIEDRSVYNQSIVNSNIVSYLFKSISLDMHNKDLITVCLILINKLLIISSANVSEYACNFNSLSVYFGFEDEKRACLNFGGEIIELNLEAEVTNNTFIKLIFLKTFSMVNPKSELQQLFLFSSKLEASEFYIYFFNRMSDLIRECNNLTSLGLLCLIIEQWLQGCHYFYTINNVCDSDLHIQCTVDLLKPNNEIFALIMDLVWKLIEETLTGCASHARQLLRDLLILYKTHCKWANLNFSSFVANFLSQFLAIPWTSKAKYVCISVLCEFMDIKLLLTPPSDLMSDLKNCLHSHYLVPISSEVYIKLIKPDININVWLDNWLYTLIEGLLSAGYSERIDTAVYWLANTLKIIPETLTIILAALNSIAEINALSLDNCFQRVQKCVKNPKSLVAIDKFDYSNLRTTSYNSLLFSLIHVVKYGIQYNLIVLDEINISPLLDVCLMSGDECIRIETFSILLISQTLQSWRLKLVQKYLIYNCNPSSANFRIKLSNLLKQGLELIKRNIINYKSLNEDENIMTSCEISDFIHFLEFLSSLAMRCLALDSPFQKIMFGLSIYESLFENITNGDAKINKKMLNTKLSAQSILKSKGFNLINTPTLFPICLYLTSDYIEIRESSARLIQPYLNTNEVIASLKLVFPEGLMFKAIKLLSSSRVYHGESGALLVKLELISKIQNNANSRRNVAFNICSSMVEVLESQFISAKQNILTAARHTPIFSAILSLVAIIKLRNEWDYSKLKMTECEFSKWTGFFDKLSILLTDISKFAINIFSCSNIDFSEAIFSGSAPSFADMGVAIETAILNSQSQNKEATLNANNVSYHTDCSSVEFQMIMNCAWLTIKETCNLICTIIEIFPIYIYSNNANNSLFISPKLVTYLGDVIINSLISCRHIGVILSCQNSLQNISSVLLLSEIPEMKELPPRWLRNVLDIILIADKTSAVSKKGAGLPLCIQSILCGESKLPHKQLLPYTMNALLSSINSTVDSNIAPPEYKHEIIEVRCINVIKVIFNDSTIGNECVLGFGEQGLMLAIKCVRSVSWQIRNAGLMLYGALTSKMIGQRKLTDNDICTNTITTRQFFTKFPLLKQFLLSQLQSKPVCNSIQMHAATYPILLLIAKLCPMPNFVTNFEEKSDYMRVLQRLCYSPVLLVRLRAADAFVNLIYSDNMVGILTYLLNSIPSTNIITSINFNFIHGHLVLILALSKCIFITYPSNYRHENAILSCLNLYIIKILNYLSSSKIPLSVKHVIIDILNIYYATSAHRSDIKFNIDDIFVSLLSSLKQTNDFYYSSYLKSVLNLILNFCKNFKCLNKHTSTSFIHFLTSVIDLMESFNVLRMIDILAQILLNSSTLVSLLSQVSKTNLYKLWKLFLNWSFNCTCETNSHPNLLYLETLLLFTDSLTDSQITSSVSPDLINYIVRLSQTERHLSTQYQSALLYFISYLLHWVHLSYISIGDAEQLIQCIVDYIYEHSKPSAPEDLRINAAYSIHVLFNDVIQNFSKLSHCPNSNSLLICLIECLILLLQDEILEIRQYATKTVSKCVLGYKTILDSYYALQILFSYVAEHFCTNKEIWKLFVEYSLAGKPANFLNIENIDKSELLLFKRGKDNIFFDDVIIIHYATTALETISMKCNDNNNNNNNNNNLIFLEFVECSIQNQLESICEQLNSRNVNEDLESIDIYLSNNSTIFKKIVGIVMLSKFHKTLNSHSNNIINIYRVIPSLRKSYLLQTFNDNM